MSMKRPSNRLGMYADVRAILDAALTAGGGSYECPSHGSAVHWRQRAYKFRKLYADILGVGIVSEYDAIVMPRVDPDSSTVDIHIRRQVGVFRPNAEPSNLPVEMDMPIDDDLLAMATKFSTKLEGE